jgi:hypothetical protein
MPRPGWTRRSKRWEMNQMEEYVCHCFGYTAADIVRDVEEHGASTILNRIRAAKAQGGCACKDKNPKGR